MEEVPQVLTFSNDNDRKTKRRTQQCSPNPCTKQKENIKKVTGQDYSIECDETPPASTEEGGDFEDKSARAATCVPQYQNGAYAGNCQGM
jgi:hypothetical protein